MRIVVLCSSLYSETGCALAMRVAEVGHVPVGALVLSTLNRGTLLRKLGQLGTREVVRYARAKLIPHRVHEPSYVRNPYLWPWLTHENRAFRSLREVAALYRFPVAVCRDQNAPDSIAQLREWSPDLMIFTGGNILRKQVLDVPSFGVLNVHLAMLPEIRGMSAPEWSLLRSAPTGITIHYMDTGIDTGPILQRCELPDGARCESLSDLRNRLVALGVAKIGEVVDGLDRGTISAIPQSSFYSNANSDSALNPESQFFVMHEWLQARAAERLTQSRPATVAGSVNG